MALIINIDSLSPTCRDRLVDSIRRVLTLSASDLTFAIPYYELSEARSEMIQWRDGAENELAYLNKQLEDAR